jgi:hypothetical protein
MNYNNEYVLQYKYDERDGKARSKYDTSHEGKELVTWEGLDQDRRAWWRALGLGVDRSTCNEANTKVTTDNKCISGKAGCSRVNYHTAKRWENDANDDALAKQRFDARDFSVIFLKYECETVTVNAAGKLENTELTVPQTSPLTWDNIDAGRYEDGRFMTAATNLGYDEDEWKAHGLAPNRPAGPPDNLVLVVENYLEGEAYFSLFLFTQMICSLIMIATSMIEIRHIFTWWHLTKKSNKKKWWHLGLSTFLSSRWSSAIAALLQYVVIPVFTIEVSLLLILESANVVDCIKDTIVSDIYKRLHARTRSCVSLLNFIPRSDRRNHTHVHGADGAPTTRSISFLSCPPLPPLPPLPAPPPCPPRPALWHCVALMNLPGGTILSDWGAEEET